MDWNNQEEEAARALQSAALEDALAACRALPPSHRLAERPWQQSMSAGLSGRGWRLRAELLANRAALVMWSGVGCNLSAVTAGF